MLSKFLKIFLLLSLLLGGATYKVDNANAASIVMWGKTELKLGQIGKATILVDTVLVKLESNGSLTNVRTMKKGEEYRVYSFKSNHGGLFGVGGGSFVQKNEKVKYETPSKSKLALLKELSENPQPETQPNVSSGLEIIPGAPSVFKNCTALKEHYPDGVQKGHPAYATKHDRDKDGWACEPSWR
ncbi:excalibur calcium-binding domain-containing protein [Psychrobacillus sp. FJAT-21963]|uniref:excalibur calcium-binding domain-containing protein n=1 Tax=Psychrobacillus sp. FJAT-21963 TaxID=1712028 RepID=UPI0007001D73|nr:excalibur calcium-binding domain-containing protein [Psychrobacillus sp. FJAT-21963]